MSEKREALARAIEAKHLEELKVAMKSPVGSIESNVFALQCLLPGLHCYG